MLDGVEAAQATEPIVYVVDDDASVRRALGRLLTSAGFEHESFSTAAEFLEHEPKDQPSCLVLDIQMPGLSGLKLQEELAKRGLEPAIVFVTGRGTVPTSVRAMKKGAIDFLQKPYDAEELLAALRRGLAVDTAGRRARAELRELQTRYEMLTPREREVLALVTSGLMNKQVGARLGTSEKTIKVHRGRVMHKMKAHSLADLVRMAERIAGGRVTEAGLD